MGTHRKIDFSFMWRLRKTFFTKEDEFHEGFELAYPQKIIIVPAVTNWKKVDEIMSG